MRHSKPISFIKVLLVSATLFYEKHLEADNRDISTLAYQIQTDCMIAAQVAEQYCSPKNFAQKDNSKKMLREKIAICQKGQAGIEGLRTQLNYTQDPKIMGNKDRLKVYALLDEVEALVAKHMATINEYFYQAASSCRTPPEVEVAAGFEDILKFQEGQTGSGPSKAKKKHKEKTEAK